MDDLDDAEEPMPPRADGHACAFAKWSKKEFTKSIAGLSPIPGSR